MKKEKCSNGEHWLTKHRRTFNTERQKEQFWIDRRGKIRRYEGDLTEEIVSFHSEIARAIFPDVEYPGDHCQKLGWVKVGATCYGFPLIDKKPTQRQLDTLLDIKQLHLLRFLYERRYVSYKEYGILCD